MILLIIGSRTFVDYARLEMEILKRWRTIALVHTGGKRTKEGGEWKEVPQDGACRQGWKFAQKYQIPVTLFLPTWQQLPNGKWKPNRDPAFLSAPDDFLACWDGASPGTLGEITELKRLGKFHEENIVYFNK